ncbi:MAG: CHAD domain-containing protein [Deltaproteobacteria bacterium]|nr:CHAD domain-containing protein [Deltaproteobacteria bacterium]TLN03554.1 MAG: CHAD domain-containing protein [bacterium]
MKKTPLWIASKGLLAERGSDFFRCLETAVITYNPVDIHDLRVASRRLREGLSLFSKCYPADRLSYMRKAVRKITDMLGDLRNIDEYLDFLREEAIELGPVHGLELADCIDRYEVKRAKAQKQLKREFRKTRPATLRKYFVRTIHSPYIFDPPSGAVDPFIAIDDFARESIDQRLASVLELVPVARLPLQAACQHRLRIAVKHYRYRIEVLSPFMDEKYREVHAHVKEYQEILGRIHDLDVFIELIRGMGIAKHTEIALAELLTAKRETSFAAFLAKLDTVPFEVIGARIRSLL